MSKKSPWVFIVAASIASGAALAVHIKNASPKSRAFINGNIITMDKDNAIAEGVILRRGSIVAVGSNEKIKKRIRRNTDVVDLKGKTMIPGFVDAHSHFPGSGLAAVAVDLNSPPIGGIKDIAELTAALKKKAKNTKKGDWILGFGYDDTALADARHPTRHDLDKVSTDHPIVIAHISFHIAVVNSLALKRLGVTSKTEDPEGGVIRRRADDGEPDGVLEETASHAAYKAAMDFSPLEAYSILKESIANYASAGVTTAQNGLAEMKMIVPMGIASRLGLIPLRLIVWPDEEVSDKILSGDFKTKKYNTETFQLGAVKLFADGSIQAYTGYLSEPYHVPFKGDESYRGYPIHECEELAAIVAKFHSAGFQIAIHGNGDAAIDDIIYAVEKAQSAHPRKDPRHILIHGQMARDDQLDAMKKVGITPSFHAVHPYYWGDRHVEIFMGPERAGRISPMNSALGKGLRFTTHLDTPVVPMDPLFLAWCCVNRISSGGRVIGASERISPMQALRSLTIDAAWQVFQEDNRGSIEPGKHADLVILSDNPLENPETIKDIKVLETIVGGKTVYKR